MFLSKTHVVYFPRGRERVTIPLRLSHDDIMTIFKAFYSDNRVSLGCFSKPFIDALPKHVMQEKPLIKELDFLVHPFYIPRYYSEVLELWKSRIDRLKKRPGHFLAIDVPELDEIGERHLESLLDYAREKLGENRVIVFPAPDDFLGNHVEIADSLKKLGFSPEKSRIHFYGEFANGCVSIRFQRLVPLLLPTSRRAGAARILAQYCTKSRGIATSVLNKEQVKADKELRDTLKIAKNGARRT